MQKDVVMKGFWIVLILIASTLNVEIYHDRSDNKRSVVVVVRDGVTTTFSVLTKDLDDPNLIDKIEEAVHGNAAAQIIGK